MTVIKMGYRNREQLALMSEWLAENTGGTPTEGRNGGMKGVGWSICYTTEMRKPVVGPNPLPYLITKAEIDNPLIATMFRLRWS
jgi:hypothetical protein